MEIYNHPNFREANKLVHEAMRLLKEAGLSKGIAYDWVKAWSSGAGDGIA